MRLVRLCSLVKLLLILIGLPLAAQGATLTGSIGDPLYLTEPDTLDVKIIKQDGVPVLTTSIIGYGTLAARNASPFATGNFWWVTDGQPPYFSRYNGTSWDILRTDPTWPIAPQTLQATHQILGCGTDRATIRLVSVQGDGGPITLSSNPQIPAGADGQVCVLWGASATATLTVADGNGIELDGISTYTVSTTQSLTLAYSTLTSRWRQIASSSGAGGGGGGEGSGTPAGATAGTSLVNLSGATATATALIPADSWVFGVTIEVTTEVTGAAGIDVGDGTDPDRWGDDIAPAQGTETNIGDFTITTPAYYGSTANVVLTAQGGNFTGGTVDIVVTYVTLESLVGGGASGSGLPPGGAGHQILKRSGNNSILEWADIKGTPNQIDVTLSLGQIVISGMQDLDPSSSPTFAGQTITQGTLTASTPVTHTAAFNNAGVTFIGKTNNFTDTASASGSILEQWPVNGINQVAIRKDGEIAASTVRLGIVTVTTNYTVAPNISFVMCDATTGTKLITLPLAATRQLGSPIWIKKIDASSNPCTISRAGSDTIEGNTAGLPLQVQYQGHMLVAGGNTLWVRF